MTTNTSPLAYDDCYLMFDRARTSRNRASKDDT